MFSWNSIPFSMIGWMLAIWSLVPLPFLNLAWTSGSSWCIYCWSLTWRILSIILLVCAAAAVKLHQSCPTLCDPIDGSPPGSLSLGFSRQEYWSGLPFLLQCMKVKRESEVAQSCPTLSDPTDYSLPGSSVHGIFQARVLEWGAIAFSYMYIYVCIYIHINLCVCMYVCVYQTTSPASWETCMQIKKQQLEVDMEQRAGSKLGKEYIKAVYCHPVYFTSM